MIIVKGRIVALEPLDGLNAGMQEKTVVEITFEDAQGGQEKSRFECQDSVVLGGVFVPVDSLPGWLQAIAWLLPMTYSIEVLNLAVVTLARNIE